MTAVALLHQQITAAREKVATLRAAAEATTTLDKEIAVTEKKLERALSKYNQHVANSNFGRLLKDAMQTALKDAQFSATLDSVVKFVPNGYPNQLIPVQLKVSDMYYSVWETSITLPFTNPITHHTGGFLNRQDRNGQQNACTDNSNIDAVITLLRDVSYEAFLSPTTDYKQALAALYAKFFISKGEIPGQDQAPYYVTGSAQYRKQMAENSAFTIFDLKLKLEQQLHKLQEHTNKVSQAKKELPEAEAEFRNLTARQIELSTKVQESINTQTDPLLEKIARLEGEVAKDLSPQRTAKDVALQAIQTAGNKIDSFKEDEIGKLLLALCATSLGSHEYECSYTTGGLDHKANIPLQSIVNCIFDRDFKLAIDGADLANTTYGLLYNIPSVLKTASKQCRSALQDVAESGAEPTPDQQALIELLGIYFALDHPELEMNATTPLAPVSLETITSIRNMLDVYKGAIETFHAASEALEDEENKISCSQRELTRAREELEQIKAAEAQKLASAKSTLKGIMAKKGSTRASAQQGASAA